MRPLPVLALTAALGGIAAPTLAEVPRVMTDLPPIQSLVGLVMGDLGQPDVLLGQGANAHDYQLKPSQARALAAADLVIWVGPEMTPWLDRSLATLAPTAGQLGLLQASGTYVQDFAATGGDDHDHEHGADHGGHDDHDDHDEHGHSHTGIDPHAWLEPANARYWIGLIGETLATRDPDNAARYLANATAAQARIDALDARITAELAPVKTRPFIVYHDAYGYFVSHYGLALDGSVSAGDAADPGAAHLSALRASLQEKGIVCAFPEANHNPRAVAHLIEGTQTRLGQPLDPEGSTLTYGPGLYETLLGKLATSLTDCLKG